MNSDMSVLVRCHRQGLTVEIVGARVALKHEVGKVWSSLSKQWSCQGLQTLAPAIWNDHHWTKIDEAFEAMKNFNNLYNKE